MTAPGPSRSTRTRRCKPAVALVFAKFRELHSAHAVMRYLRANGLPLPVRPLRGPAPHDVVWREADQRPGPQHPSKSRPMPARMFMVAGDRLPVRRGQDRAAPARSRFPSPSGRSACRRLIRATSAGRSSWPTSGVWPTTSTATTAGHAGRPAQGLQRCCRALPCAAAAAAA